MKPDFIGVLESRRRPKFQEEVCSQTSFFIVCISRKGVFIGLPRV